MMAHAHVARKHFHSATERLIMGGARRKTVIVDCSTLESTQGQPKCAQCCRLTSYARSEFHLRESIHYPLDKISPPPPPVDKAYPHGMSKTTGVSPPPMFLKAISIPLSN